MADRSEVSARLESHRGEYFWEIRFRGSSIRFAARITTHLLWDVTGSCTCVLIFVDKLHFPEILVRIKSRSQPHSGLRRFQQKYICLTQSMLGPYVVHIWSPAVFREDETPGLLRVNRLCFKFRLTLEPFFTCGLQISGVVHQPCEVAQIQAWKLNQLVA